MSASPTTEAPRPEPPGRPEPLYVKLHPGPGPDHDAVAGNQRSRLIGAMIEEVAEHGYAGATLARLVALAGVSKRAFHELFGTKEAYFLATHDAIVGNAVRRIGVAYRSEGDWRARLRAGFAAYAAEVVEEPKAARRVLVEVLGAGPAALARMRRTRRIFEEAVSATFREAPDGVTLPPLIAKGILCGVERITRQRLLAGDSIGELADGVARPARMQGLELPRHVLARLCVDTGRYERSGWRIRRAPGHPGWKDVLARNEATLVQTLLDHGPLMRRADLQRIAVGERGLSLRSFIVYLNISPVLARHAYGVYGLRGRQDTPAQAIALSPTRARGSTPPLEAK
jgi:AcrR family transcriptional regulator